MARMMGRLLLLTILLASSVGSASAQASKERAAILAIELGKGVQEFVRAKATAQVQQGLQAAGYDVVPPEQTSKQLPPDLAACKSGPCLAQVAKTVSATSLVHVSITRKHDSQIIVMRMLDPTTGDAIADIHEVCDLCGQEELEERIGVAASALRAKAVAALAKRPAVTPAVAAPTVVAQASGPLRVAIIPGIAVNLDTARVDALSQELAEALMVELDIQAVGGLEVRRQLPPDGIPADCVTTPTCTADVARRTNTTQLLFVVMVDSGSGGSVQIDTTWVDATNNQSASRPAIDLTNPSEAKGKFTAAARTLLPDAPVRKKDTDTTPGGGGITPTYTEGVPRHFSTPAKISAAVAGVGLGAGIAFGLVTRSKYNKCEDDLVGCTNSKRDSIRTFSILADTGFVIAIGAAIATVALYATSSEEPRLIVAPTADGATVGAFGRF